MNEISIERNPMIIAAEINSIKDQTRKMVLYNSIEIGRRLAEAKSMLPHGQWGEWLQNSVDYSQSTANNLMRIFEEYGSDQLAFFDNNANSQALGNLSYTQAVALLGIPKDEREAFVEEHDLDEMSTRELQQAIKEKQELEERLKTIETSWVMDRKVAQEKTEEAKKLLKEKEQLENEIRESKDQVERLNDELREAKDQGSSDEEVAQLQKELEAARDLVNKLTEELNEPIEVTATSVEEKVPEAVQRELKELREKNKELEEAKGSQPLNSAIMGFEFHFKSLVKGFGNLLGILDQIQGDEQAKYKNAVKGLIDKMTERL